MSRTRYPGIYSRLSRGHTVYDATASYDSKQKQKRGLTLAEARTWQAETLEDMRAGRLGKAPARLTFGDYFLKTWLPNKEPGLKPKSVLSYGFHGRHIVAALGEKRLSALTPPDVRAFLTSMASEGLAPNSRRVIYSILHASLEDARIDRLIGVNPCQDLSPPKAEKRALPRIDKPAVRRILEAARGTPYELMVYMAVTTGMRFGELAALRWSDIDFANSALYIEQGKTEKSVRGVALDERTLEALRQHRLQQMRPGEEKQPELVFLSKLGKPFRQLAHAHWRDIVDRAELPENLRGLHFHDLRHVHQTLMTRAGIHLSIMKERLGHSSITTTDGIYTHMDVEDQRAAAQAMADFLGSP